MTEETEKKPAQNTSLETSSLRRTRLIAWIFTAIVTLAFIAWLYYPAIYHFTRPAPSATPALPTPTLWPTRTSTVMPTATLRPTTTPTSMAASSAFFVPDLSSIDPALPGETGSGFILDESNAVTANPGFDNPIWTNSATISTQLGFEILEPFYATLGAASVTWSMDENLSPGLYEIYVMDTVFSSGGSLSFKVMNNGTDIFPYLGTQVVNYQSLRGTPQQVQDVWHSIGMYNLEQEGIISVSTSWDVRDEYTIVAVDRVLIIPRPAVTYSIMSKLPLGKQITLLDDPNAVIENAGTVISLEDKPAWNGKAEVIINPDDTLRVTWSTQDPIPIGRYAVWVWIPEVNGDAQAKYRLMVNEDQLTAVEGTDPGPIVHGSRQGGAWMPVGEWEIGPFYSPSARLSLVMETVSGSTTGELAVDAVAFIKLD